MFNYSVPLKYESYTKCSCSSGKYLTKLSIFPHFDERTTAKRIYLTRPGLGLESGYFNYSYLFRVSMPRTVKIITNYRPQSCTSIG